MVKHLSDSINASLRYANSDLVKELDIQAPHFAMALNQQVVPKSKYYSTIIKENDEIEIVHAVGGGI